MNGQKTNNSYKISNIKDRIIRVTVNPTFNNSYLNKTWLNLYRQKEYQHYIPRLCKSRLSVRVSVLFRPLNNQ